MIAVALHVLPDGLLVEGEGGGRALVVAALALFAVTSFRALGRTDLAARLTVGRRAALATLPLVGGALGAWLADGLMTGTLAPAGFSLLGAALAGPLAALATARALVLPWRPVLDRLALPGLAAAALARLGCLLGGCDLGRAADGVPLAVRYAAHTHAFDRLAARGDVLPHASMTGPLHPFPLYEVALVLAVALTLALVRRRLAPGVAAALAAAGYLAARAIADGFRDGADPARPAAPTLVAASLALLALASAWRLARAGRPLPAAVSPPRSPPTPIPETSR